VIERLETGLVEDQGETEEQFDKDDRYIPNWDFSRDPSDHGPMAHGQRARGG